MSYKNGNLFINFQALNQSVYLCCFAIKWYRTKWLKYFYFYFRFFFAGIMILWEEKEGFVIHFDIWGYETPIKTWEVRI